ncbi:VOC family protein [Terrarubrum flagellatum]|uniref:VOC family protein n=1 Tax=Terrirubrum flagellatum TaxID=2895980 RepID=UPI003144DC99
MGNGEGRSPTDAFGFGQPVGAVVQYAYTVPDIASGMKLYSKLLGVGPWFVTGPFRPREARYRGSSTEIELTLAIGFAGRVMVELVRQHDDGPSVYREFVERRGHGFHHWAIGSKAFDADVARYCSDGYEIAFADRAPRGNRVVYVDTSRDLPGMLEIIEMTDVLETRYEMMYAAACGWDGSDPIRS